MGKVHVLNFAGDCVALLVRGKTNHAHDPDLLNQHADCVLSNGAPIGFFGELPGGAMSGPASRPDGPSASSGGTSGSVGMGLDGAVYDMDEFRRKRPHYVDPVVAKQYKVVTAVLRIQTTSAEASAFDAYWAKLDIHPAHFYMLGGNCSTRAARGFAAAGITGGGIPGLDTPNNLYRQLCRERAGKVTAAFGYVGFVATGSGGGYQVTVEEV